MKRSSKNLPKDPYKLAHEIVRLSLEGTDRTEKEDQLYERSALPGYLAQIRRKAGLKGGKARAKKLASEQRKTISQKAPKARWGKSGT